MAPEILAKKEYSGSPIDIYTMGIVLYCMLIGRLPFAGHTDREMHRRIMKGIYHVPKDLSEFAEKLMGRMMAVEPADRPTAEEVLKMLEGAEK